jgi:hypothetical protein
MNADLRSHRIVPLADEDTPSDAEALLVKCVEANYEAADHVPRNTWLGGQSCFGWIPTKSAEVVELWKELEFNDLERIAPKMIAGRHPETWESIAD